MIFQDTFARGLNINWRYEIKVLQEVNLIMIIIQEFFICVRNDLRNYHLFCFFTSCKSLGVYDLLRQLSCNVGYSEIIRTSSTFFNNKSYVFSKAI